MATDPSSEPGWSSLVAPTYSPASAPAGGANTAQAKHALAVGEIDGGGVRRTLIGPPAERRVLGKSALHRLRAHRSDNDMPGLC
jgi:hypothetical protein